MTMAISSIALERYVLTIILLRVPFFSVLSFLLQRHWAAIPSLDFREAKGVHPLSYSSLLLSSLILDRLEGGYPLAFSRMPGGGRGHANYSFRKAGVGISSLI